MAGAYSGHLVDAYHSAQFNARGPFGQLPSSSTQISVHGPMSFNSQMHGTVASGSSSFDDSYMEMSRQTALDIARLQETLSQRLGPEFISERPGYGGGGKVAYIPGWKVINLANEVFGFDGWSSSVLSFTTDYLDRNNGGKWDGGVTVVMRVTLRGGVFHEDIGYGNASNMPDRGGLLEKCKKEAVTDGLKRCLRNFGNLMGNCLYDNSFTAEVKKIKVPPAKYDQKDLYRRKEFQEHQVSNPSSASTSKASTSSTSLKPAPNPQNVSNGNQRSGNLNSSSGVKNAGAVAIKSEVKPSMLPPNGIPPHMRSIAGASTPNNNRTASHSASRPGMGLQTPITTPVHRSAAPAPVVAPPSLQPQQERRVSFTELPPPPPAIDFDDNMYSFGSDDDLLATMDLGELEEGLPMYDEDGREVEPEEPPSGYSEPELPLPEMRNDSRAHQSNSYLSTSTGAQAGQQDSGLPPKTATPESGAQPATKSDPSAAGMLSSRPPNQAQPQRQHPQFQRSVSASSNTPNPGPRQPLQPVNPHSHPNPSSTSSNVDLNSSVTGEGKSTTSTNSNAAMKRTNTPASGGFHFPPGIAGQQNHNQQNRQSLGGGAQAQAGGMAMKRKADQAQMEPRRPGPGMGLMSAPHGQRQPLARLDGGEAKRMRM